MHAEGKEAMTTREPTAPPTDAVKPAPPPAPPKRKPVMRVHECPAGKCECDAYHPDFPKDCLALSTNDETIITDIENADTCPHPHMQIRATAVRTLPEKKKYVEEAYHCPAGKVRCKRYIHMDHLGNDASACQTDNGLIDLRKCEVCPCPSIQQVVSNEKVGQRTISIAQCAQHPNSMPILFTRANEIVVGPYCGQCLDTSLGAVLQKLDVKEL
jgi:hypothetical protein